MAADVRSVSLETKKRGKLIAKKTERRDVGKQVMTSSSRRAKHVDRPSLHHPVMQSKLLREEGRVSF